MKAYMVFSITGGSPEGACLVFARNLQEARKVAWKECDWEITDEWIDVGARLLKEAFIFEEADKDNLKAGIAHCISAPASCKDCNMWGYPINSEGYCETCAEDREIILSPNV